MSLATRAAEWTTPARSLHLGGGDVHVWRVNVADMMQCAMPLDRVLSPDERARGDSLFFEADRARFMVARTSLRVILSGYLRIPAIDVAFVSSARGKPSLGGRHRRDDIRFNVAHSGAWAVYAFARGRAVGIDIERKRAVATADGIASWSFSKDERQQLALADACHEDTFFDIWTHKEARIKASGAGLFATLANQQVDAAHCDEFSVQSLAVASGYSAALAVAGSSCQPALFDCTREFLMAAIKARRNRTKMPRPSASSAPSHFHSATR